MKLAPRDAALETNPAYERCVNDGSSASAIISRACHRFSVYGTSIGTRTSGDSAASSAAGAPAPPPPPPLQHIDPATAVLLGDSAFGLSADTSAGIPSALLLLRLARWRSASRRTRRCHQSS